MQEATDEQKLASPVERTHVKSSGRNAIIAIAISALVVFGLFVFIGHQSGPPADLEAATTANNAGDDDDELPLLIAGLPKDEAFLINYDHFQTAYRLAPEMPSELVFISELLSIAQHNLAALSGEETFYKRQSPFKMRLDDKYKHMSWSDLPLDLLVEARARQEQQQQEQQQQQESEDEDLEGSVSAPSAELKRVNMLGKWLQRLTKNEAHFEIPSFPLDQQPEPERVTHIDADLRYCTDAIKDQQACGACYAFSWLSLAEWHHCRQTNDGSVVDFSEQHVVDCGHVARLNGCVEGKLSDVKDFTQVFGIHLERDYPYTSKRGACKAQTGSLAVKVNDFKRIKVDRDEFERTLEEQPILLEVHLPADIASYSSGIHPGANCDSQLGHGMLLVGHGRQEGRPYWLLRNSMGRRWGENGYLRLARDMPHMDRCFKSAFVAKFKFRSLDEDKYVDFYDSLEFEPSLDPATAAARRQQSAGGADNMNKLLSGQ